MQIVAARSRPRILATRPPVERIAWTLDRLRAGRQLKATDIARRFEVGIRTAYRDLDYLRDSLRVPLDYDRPKASYRLTGPTTVLPDMVLGEGELIALYFAEKVLRQYRGTPWEADLESAFRKIRRLLPEEVYVSSQDLDDLLSIDLGPVRASDAAIFRTVVGGLRRRRRLAIRYRSLNSARTLDREIDPCRLFNARGDWYVAAFDHLRKEVRDFAISRISRASVLDAAFEIDPSFDFERYRRAGFGLVRGERPVNVVIRFTERQARWIRERQWHPTARIRERRDGGCDLLLKVPITEEVVRFVMQFGAEAEVIAPALLRGCVASEARRTTRLYGRQGPRGPQCGFSTSTGT